MNSIVSFKYFKIIIKLLMWYLKFEECTYSYGFLAFYFHSKR
jgi:hypothetical protein